MVYNPIPKTIGLIKKLGVVFFLYQICRFLFYFINIESFSNVDLNVFLGGIRFDVTAIIQINVFFIIWSLLPLKWPYNDNIQRVENVIFSVVNIMFLTTNIIDIVYYNYTDTRSTFNLITASGMEGDIQRLLIPYIIQYWYLLVILMAIVFLLILALRKIGYVSNENKSNKPIPTTIYLLLIVGLFFTGFRGGFQPRDISILHASMHCSPQNVHLVLKTPFCIINTYNETDTEADFSYFPERELTKYYQYKRNYSSGSVNKKNIVLIILESFGNSNVGFENMGKGYTPFLDSLITKSLYFKNGFANGRRSIEAIPSIISGIPSLMTTAFLNSKYSINQHESLPNLLSKIGYSSHFYYGAYNGSQNFDSFSNIAGFDRYIGLNEYPYDCGIEKSWGVFDEEFLSFFCEDLSKQKQPFLGLCFTLSSHSPFIIPDKYVGQFPVGPKEIHEPIGYTDYSLKQFFKKAKQENWYNNTVFILTSDHSSWDFGYYSTTMGRHDIPILFFDPSNDTLANVSEHLFQQTDIMPSILDYINYPYSFNSLGKSFSEKDNIVAFRRNNVYHFVNDKYKITFNGKEILEIYNWKNDKMQNENLLNTHKDSVQNLEFYAKAYLQSYFKYINSTQNDH
ncbi:MAG: sulfatase-like hydrolase/transferase [Flavobacteriales bacterium]|nr:sulfatase-like hydrolase/transferase [Flavobacteriales bacterium]